MPGKHALVRADKIGTTDCRALGLVGDKYEALQNRDAFRFSDEIAGEGAGLARYLARVFHAPADVDDERAWEAAVEVANAKGQPVPS